MLLIAVILAALLGTHGSSHRTATARDRATVSFGYEPNVPGWIRGLDLNNEWVVTAAASSMSAYAGSESTDHRNGLLVFSPPGDRLVVRHAVMRGSGPLTIVPPLPSLESVQATAHATIHFVAADGATGILKLAAGNSSLSLI